MRRFLPILVLLTGLVTNAWGYDSTFQRSTPDVSVSSDSDAVVVSEANNILVDASGGTVTIGGLSGGSIGQIVNIINTDDTNPLIIEHNESSGTEKFVLPGDADASFSNTGGLSVRYDGTFWVGFASTIAIPATLDDAYNAGSAVIDVDAYDVHWDLDGAFSHVVDLQETEGTADGFSVVNGNDQFDLIRKGADLTDLDVDLQNIDISASVNMTLAAAGTFTLTTPTIGDYTNATHDHTGPPGGGTIAHSVTTGQGVDDHHAQTHTIVSHDTTATGANLNTLIGAADTTLHYHDADRARANHTGTQAATTVSLATVSTPTYDDLNDWWNTTQSAGIASGAVISDGGSGTIDVSDAKGVVKSTNSEIGVNYWFDLTGLTGQALTDNDTNWIALDYNSGTPQWVVSLSNTANGHTIFNIGKVYREGTSVDIIDSGLNIYDFTKRTQQHHVEEAALHFVSGAIVGETGTNNISVSAGVMYAGINRIVTDAIDTSVADDFEYYYNDGAWQESDETDINNLQYNNVGVGLATLSNNQYGIHWVYKGTNSSTYVIYGQASYTLAGAQAAQPPSSLPDHVEGFGVLRAKIIILKSAVVFTEIESVTDTQFTSSTASNHNELANIDGGTAGEYYHLTSAEYSALGNMTLDDAYDASGGASSIDVNDGDVTWNTATSHSFVVDISANTSTRDGFLINNGSDFFDVKRNNTNIIYWQAEVGTCDIDSSGSIAIDGSSSISLDSATASNFTVSGATADLTLGARAGTVTLNESGQTTLSGFSATSIIGALNENNASVAATTLDVAYNNDSGSADIKVDAGDVRWDVNGPYSHVVDIKGCTETNQHGEDGFLVEGISDHFRLYNYWDEGLLRGIHLSADLYRVDIDTSSAVTIDATSTIEWSGTNASLTSAGALTLASGASPTEFSIDGTLAGDSDTAVPTEQAVKTYIDAHKDLVAEPHGTTEVVNAASDEFTATELRFFVTYTSTGICTITLSSAEIAKVGRKFIITDAGRNASVNSILIVSEGAETFNGESSAEIANDGESHTWVSSGSDLFFE